MNINGKFITFEGGDGSGKSTQIRKLAAHLQEQGHDVVLTREPGGSPGAEEIRQLILTGDTDRWSDVTELMLFNAARRDHVEKTIQPAIDRGAIVLCDRFVDSSRVYQGVTRSDLLQTVNDIHRMVIGLEADMTVLLDLDPGEALRRGMMRIESEDRFENFGLSFQEKISLGFSGLAETYPDRVVRVRASGTIDEVFARVCAAITARYPADENTPSPAH